MKFTLNLPLGLLEQMDAHGYSSWLAMVKELHESERVEFTGTGAYHPLLTKIPRYFVEKQIMLNEYSLGYYFGRKNGFEGDPSVLIKDINGVFPPELAVNSDLINTLDELGYKWVLVDECATPQNVYRKDNIFEFGDKNILVVARNTFLSNLISFKRNTDIDDVINYIEQNSDKRGFFIVALDGEMFGHHFDEGIYFLETLLDKLSSMGIDVTTVSNIVSNNRTQKLDDINESSWGSTFDDIKNGNAYPEWADDKNKTQVIQWQLLSHLIEGQESLDSQHSFGSKAYFGHETLPIWKTKELDSLEDKELQKYLAQDIILDKLMASDQFWWASKKILPYNTSIYNPDIVRSYLRLYETYASLIQDNSLSDFIRTKIKEIESTLD